MIEKTQSENITKKLQFNLRIPHRKNIQYQNNHKNCNEIFDMRESYLTTNSPIQSSQMIFKDSQNTDQIENSDQSIVDKKKECLFCPRLKTFYDSTKMINRALFLKYSSSQNFHYIKEINFLVENESNQKVINFNDQIAYEEQYEYATELFLQPILADKLQFLLEYYKYHKEIPRLFMLPLFYTMNKFHDKKRRVEYYQIKNMLAKQHQSHLNQSEKLKSEAEGNRELQVYQQHDDQSKIEFRSKILDFISLNSLQNEKNNKICNNSKEINDLTNFAQQNLKNNNKSNDINELTDYIQLNLNQKNENIEKYFNQSFTPIKKNKNNDIFQQNLSNHQNGNHNTPQNNFKNSQSISTQFSLVDIQNIFSPLYQIQQDNCINEKLQKNQKENNNQPKKEKKIIEQILNLHQKTQNLDELLKIDQDLVKSQLEMQQSKLQVNFKKQNQRTKQNIKEKYPKQKQNSQQKHQQQRCQELNILNLYQLINTNTNKNLIEIKQRTLENESDQKNIFFKKIQLQKESQNIFQIKAKTLQNLISKQKSNNENQNLKLVEIHPATKNSTQPDQFIQKIQSNQFQQTQEKTNQKKKQLKSSQRASKSLSVSSRRNDNQSQINNNKQLKVIINKNQQQNIQNIVNNNIIVQQNYHLKQHQQNFQRSSSDLKSKNNYCTSTYESKLTSLQKIYQPQFLGRKKESLTNSGQYCVAQTTLINPHLNSISNRNSSRDINYNNLSSSMQQQSLNQNIISSRNFPQKNSIYKQSLQKITNFKQINQYKLKSQLNNQQSTKQLQLSKPELIHLKQKKAIPQKNYQNISLTYKKFANLLQQGQQLNSLIQNCSQSFGKNCNKTNYSYQQKNLNQQQLRSISEKRQKISSLSLIQKLINVKKPLNGRQSNNLQKHNINNQQNQIGKAYQMNSKNNLLQQKCNKISYSRSLSCLGGNNSQINFFNQQNYNKFEAQKIYQLQQNNSNFNCQRKLNQFKPINALLQNNIQTSTCRPNSQQNKKNTLFQIFGKQFPSNRLKLKQCVSQTQLQNKVIKNFNQGFKKLQSLKQQLLIFDKQNTQNSSFNLSHPQINLSQSILARLKQNQSGLRSSLIVNIQKENQSFVQSAHKRTNLIKNILMKYNQQNIH